MAHHEKELATRSNDLSAVPVINGEETLLQVSPRPLPHPWHTHIHTSKKTSIIIIKSWVEKSGRVAQAFNPRNQEAEKHFIGQSILPI